MATYYKMPFISAEPLYAKIREELRSYFDSGAIDDSMFPIWVNYCIKKFRKTALLIKPVVMELNGGETPLPDDFNSIRELWLCTNINRHIPSASAFYYQKDCRVTSIDDNCNECFTGPRNPYVCDNIPTPPLPCSPCDKKYIVTHKVQNTLLYSFNLAYLLSPGNINARGHCGDGCVNLNSSALDSFDIRDCKIITNFTSGTLYMLYYSNSTDEEREQLIPDQVHIQDYIEHYIKYKIFEYLTNQVTDESFRILENKMQYYKNEYSENYIIALAEMKKKTIYDVNRDIIKTKNRFRNYKIR